MFFDGLTSYGNEATWRGCAALWTLRHPPRGNRYRISLPRGVGCAKRAFLRNEPEFPTRHYEQILLGGSRLGCANGFFNSGSFGVKMKEPGGVATVTSLPRSSTARDSGQAGPEAGTDSTSTACAGRRGE